MNPSIPSLPVAVIGAGPVGLAAAVHLLRRGFTPLVFEAGSGIASHLESYRHVRLFSPWQYNIDVEARRLLEQQGWASPAAELLPTAGELIDQYLTPLAKLRSVKSALRFQHRVIGIARKGVDKVTTAGRENVSFVLRVATPDGIEEHFASAVIDASGTWGTPNPLGANGLPALGEAESANRIAYGMPDVTGQLRSTYIDKRTLVVGSGHSAAGTLIQLAQLADEAPGTQLVWALRGHNFQRIFGGGSNDGLPARGALGLRLRQLKDSGRLALHADFRAGQLLQDNGKLSVVGEHADGTPHRIDGIDNIIVAAGARPDHSISAELRVRFDPWLESTELLAPLIDPNVHSCGTVRPHGHRELAHPEARFYAVGAKSYGRAPNFLLVTGYEQVRSVVAALAGDIKAADEVHLELPETGVCSTNRSEPKTAGCCGGPPKKDPSACCVADETARATGKTGCGCSSAAPKRQANSPCCA